MSAPVAGIDRSAATPARLAREANKDPRRVPELIEGLNAKAARSRYGCAKALRLLSEEHPEALYPHFDFFAGLLDHPNKIFQWEAIFVLSQLARVDAADKFSGIFGRYFAPIRGPVMITAANVIGGGARIALARPRLADRICSEILKVSKAQYKTAECRNIAIGHAILALGEILGLLRDPAPAIKFVQGQIENSRPATRKKAEKFLKANAI
jgi:hypothetical protein